MANMSYCRFRNTLLDMRDCFSSVENFDTEELSKEEFEAYKDMVREMVEFLMGRDIITTCDEDGEYVEDKTDEYLNVLEQNIRLK